MLTPVSNFAELRFQFPAHFANQGDCASFLKVGRRKAEFLPECPGEVSMTTEAGLERDAG